MHDAYIIQPDCLGDLLFLQKMFSELSNKNVFNSINILVETNLLEYSSKFGKLKNVNYYDINTFQYDIPKNHYDLIKLTYNILIRKKECQVIVDHEHKVVMYPLNLSWMKDVYNQLKWKYSMCNMNHNDWVNYLHIERNYKKERKLYKKLNPKNLDYVLVNRNYGNRSNVFSYDEKGNEIGKLRYPEEGYQKDIKNPRKFFITMDIIKDYSLFDWLTVIENASEIRTTETSICYLIEMLYNEGKMKKCNNYKLWTRWKPAKLGYTFTQGLFKVPWKRMNTT